MGQKNMQGDTDILDSGKLKKKRPSGSFRHGSAETNLTSTHEESG